MAEPPDVPRPDEIRALLPEWDREWFLAEYRAAAEAATHDPAQWDQLRELLRHWHLRSVARQSPGYYESQAQALRGEGSSVSLEEMKCRHGVDAPTRR